MKQIWNRYSYGILLVCLSCLLAFIAAEKSATPIDDNYVTITVENGDSLWELAKIYEEEHGLSSKQFINWVKKTNEIGNQIYVGDEIVIPVKKQELFIASNKSN